MMRIRGSYRHIPFNYYIKNMNILGAFFNFSNFNYTMKIQGRENLNKRKMIGSKKRLNDRRMKVSVLNGYGKEDMMTFGNNLPHEG